MAKSKMKAQLRYYKDADGNEGYATNILSNGSWNTSKKFPLFAREGGDGAPDFVHWNVLLELSRLQSLGYEIDLQF